MLPPTPPNVQKYGVYKIDATCDLLWCCRDTLRKWSETNAIGRNYLDDDTVVYYAKDILRFWFTKTRQHFTEILLDKLLDSIAANGYEATIGCAAPVRPVKKRNNK